MEHVSYNLLNPYPTLKNPQILLNSPSFGPRASHRSSASTFSIMYDLHLIGSVVTTLRLSSWWAIALFSNC